LETEVQALICGVRLYEKKDSSGKVTATYKFVDWYAKGAYTSLVPDVLENQLREAVGTTVDLTVEIRERKGRVNYVIKLVA
jgi:hypothetical protein